MSFSFHIITYGCKVNQYESQAIREKWQSFGASEVFALTQDQAIDIFLLSGCAVTATAISDARQMLGKLSRDFPNSKIIVTGCAAGAEPQDFQNKNVLACIAQKDKANLLEFHPFELPEKFVENNNFPNFEITDFARSRPILKIQDGCSHACTYCIVPYTRGKARSRDVKSSLSELGRLLDAGFREIMISGINLRQYYADKENFWGFLRRVQNEFGKEWTGRARLRLSSLEPKQLNNEALETLEQCQLLCPHLHLSLQSGSASVLARMGREHYKPEQIVETVGKLKFWPKFALGSDILMGFPAENEQEVQETLQMVKSLPLTYSHVFPYSVRPYTKAAQIPNQLPKKQKQEHAARVRHEIEIKKSNFLKSMLLEEQMQISLDLGEKNVGWNEYYVSCLLPQAIQSHELQRVKAVSVENDKLITTYI